jgi:WD40 repeat protein
VLGAHDAPCEALAFSPDSTRIATTGADATLRVWTVRGGAAASKLALGASGPASTLVAWSPDGNHVATADGGGGLRVWDVDARTSRPLVGQVGSVNAITFAAGGRLLLSAGHDRALHAWDVVGHRPPRTFEGHGGPIGGVGVAPDGVRAVTCSDDGTARIWNLEDGSSRVLLGHVGPVILCELSRDGDQVLTTGIGGARVWDASPAAEVALRGHDGAVHRLAWSKDGHYVASASDDHTARVWDVGAQREEAVIDGLGRRVMLVRFLGQDGARVVLGTEGGVVRVWSLSTRALVHDFKLGAKPRDLTATRDGKTVIVADAAGIVHVLDVASGAERTFRAHDGKANGLSLSPDELTLASTGADGTVRLWDVATGTPRAVLRGHTGESSAARFSPDGALLASAGLDETIRLWDPRAGTALRVLKGFTGQAAHLAFSLDGKHLFAGGDDATIRDWDTTAASDEPRRLEGHTDRVRSLDVSTDGKLLVSSSEDGTTRLWDAPTGRQLALFRVPDAMLDASFAPDGSRIAAAGLDGVVRVRKVEPATFLPTDTGALRAWLDRQTTAVVDDRGGLASPSSATTK